MNDWRSSGIGVNCATEPANRAAQPHAFLRKIIKKHPIQPVDLIALKAAAAKLDALRAASGISEDELLAEFRHLRTGQNR